MKWNFLFEYLSSMHSSVLTKCIHSSVRSIYFWESSSNHSFILENSYSSWRSPRHWRRYMLKRFRQPWVICASPTRGGYWSYSELQFYSHHLRNLTLSYPPMAKSLFACVFRAFFPCGGSIFSQSHKNLWKCFFIRFSEWINRLCHFFAISGPDSLVKCCSWNISSSIWEFERPKILGQLRTGDCSS